MGSAHEFSTQVRIKPEGGDHVPGRGCLNNTSRARATRPVDEALVGHERRCSWDEFFGDKMRLGFHMLC